MCRYTLYEQHCHACSCVMQTLRLRIRLCPPKERQKRLAEQQQKLRDEFTKIEIDFDDADPSGEHERGRGRTRHTAAQPRRAWGGRSKRGERRLRRVAGSGDLRGMVVAGSSDIMEEDVVMGEAPRTARDDDDDNVGDPDYMDVDEDGDEKMVDAEMAMDLDTEEAEEVECEQVQEAMLPVDYGTCWKCGGLRATVVMQGAYCL